MQPLISHWNWATLKRKSAFSIGKKKNERSADKENDQHKVGRGRINMVS